MEEQDSGTDSLPRNPRKYTNAGAGAGVLGCAGVRRLIHGSAVPWRPRASMGGLRPRRLCKPACVAVSDSATIGRLKPAAVGPSPTPLRITLAASVKQWLRYTAGRRSRHGRAV